MVLASVGCGSGLAAFLCLIINDMYVLAPWCGMPWSEVPLNVLKMHCGISALADTLTISCGAFVASALATLIVPPWAHFTRTRRAHARANGQFVPQGILEERPVYLRSIQEPNRP